MTHKYDDVLLEEERFAQGGFAEFRLGEQYSSREVSEGRGSIIGGSKCPAGLEDRSFWGWGGAGGSAFVWSMQLEVGMAYVMNGQSAYVLGGPRTQRIFTALFACIASLMMPPPPPHSTAV